MQLDQVPTMNYQQQLPAKFMQRAHALPAMLYGHLVLPVAYMTLFFYGERKSYVFYKKGETYGESKSYNMKTAESPSRRWCRQGVDRDSTSARRVAVSPADRQLRLQVKKEDNQTRVVA